MGNITSNLESLAQLKTNALEEQKPQQEDAPARDPAPRSKSVVLLEPMNHFQDSLPRLPIPALEDTCDRFLRYTAPMLSEAEYQVTETAVREFLEGEGQSLQANLKLYDADPVKTNSSYIESFWDDAYLVTDEPTLINVNPYFVLEDDPDPTHRNNQCLRASSLVDSALKFILAVRSGTLVPDNVRGKLPLDMAQYEKLFNVARIPGLQGRDEFVQFDYQAREHKTSHIVVLAQGQVYYFDVLSKDGKSMSITPLELFSNFVKIKEAATGEAANESFCVGPLTGGKRSTWGVTRQSLVEHSSQNAKAIQLIDSALFVVCLDSVSPESHADQVQNALCGLHNVESDNHDGLGSSQNSCFNRWYDKLQLIVCENGSAMVNFEHSATDGHTVLRFAGDMYADTLVKFAQSISGKRHVRSTLKSVRLPGTKKHSPRRLRFAGTEDDMEAVESSKVALLAFVQQFSMGALEYTKFGKQFVVGNRLSPDAFVQLAMLAAYYQAWNLESDKLSPDVLACTYESVMTKHFQRGRTEAGRSATSEALNFVQHLTSTKQADLSDEESEAHDAKTLELLETATRAHSAMTRECSAGNGVDRHLYGLKCIWNESNDDPDAQPPALFSSPGYKALSTTMLSTSNCGNPSLRFFGFGPVSAEGVGVGYIIKDHQVQFSFSSKSLAADKYLGALEKYLDDIRALLSKRHRPSEVAREVSGSQEDHGEVVGEAL